MADILWGMAQMACGVALWTGGFYMLGRSHGYDRGRRRAAPPIAPKP